LHLVGIYITSITKMHGTMNIKKKNTCCSVSGLFVEVYILVHVYLYVLSIELFINPHI